LETRSLRSQFKSLSRLVEGRRKGGKEEVGEGQGEDRWKKKSFLATTHL
jgi:hypothetical protein